MHEIMPSTKVKGTAHYVVVYKIQGREFYCYPWPDV